MKRSLTVGITEITTVEVTISRNNSKHNNFYQPTSLLRSCQNQVYHKRKK